MIWSRNSRVLVLAALLLTSCATGNKGTKEYVDIKPGERPAVESDEAGLWMVMDQVDEAVRTSGRVIEDKKLNAYLNKILCKLAPKHCKDIRIDIIRAAGFNASAAPNGSLRVWSGLFLRVQNEAQLAYVLGHELAHYLRRHTLQKWRDTRARTDGFAVFSAMTLGLGNVAGIFVAGDIMAFSRDLESESDRLGLEMMAKAGYDPREASKSWRIVMDERDASNEPEGWIFFASHPADQERVDTLTAMAKKMRKGKRRIGRKSLDRAIARHRSEWLRDELRNRDYAALQVVLDSHKKAKLGLGEVHFTQGELYRLRGEDGDKAKAVKAYRAAIATKRAPPETYRALGLMYLSMKKMTAARRAFTSYLKVRPKADDRAMIKSYIQQTKK